MVKGTNLKGEGIKIKASEKKKRKKGSSGSEEIKLKKGRSSRGSTQEKEKKARKKGRRTLDPLREQLQVLVNQANQRVDELTNQNLKSRALEEARRSLLRSPSRIDDMKAGILFRSDLSNREKINRELARVHAFLNDYTSAVDGHVRADDDVRAHGLGDVHGIIVPHAAVQEHFAVLPDSQIGRAHV